MGNELQKPVAPFPIENCKDTQNTNTPGTPGTPGTPALKGKFANISRFGSSGNDNTMGYVLIAAAIFLFFYFKKKGYFKKK